MGFIRKDLSLLLCLFPSLVPNPFRTKFHFSVLKKGCRSCVSSPKDRLRPRRRPRRFQRFERSHLTPKKKKKKGVVAAPRIWRINNPVVFRGPRTPSNLTHQRRPPINFQRKESEGRPGAPIGGTPRPPWWITSEPNERLQINGLERTHTHIYTHTSKHVCFIPFKISFFFHTHTHTHTAHTHAGCYRIGAWWWHYICRGGEGRIQKAHM